MNKVQQRQNHDRGQANTGSNSGGTAEAKQAAQEAGQEAKAQAKQAADELKQKGSELADKAQRQAGEALEKGRHQAAGQVGGVAGVLRDTADRLDGDQAWMADGIQRAAGALDDVAERLRTEDLNGVVRRVADYTRREPVVVLAGAAVAGFLLARFMKSSASRDHTDASAYDARENYRG